VKVDAGSTVPLLKSATRRAKGHISSTSFARGATGAHGCALDVTGSSFDASERPGFAAKRPTRENDRSGVSALRHWCQRSHRSRTATGSVTAGSSSVAPSSAHPRAQSAITRGGPQATTTDPLQRYGSSPQTTGARAPEGGESAMGGSEVDGEQSCRFARATESGISRSSATHPPSHWPTTCQGHAQLSVGAHGSG
jgi:hypothetical protein